MHSVMLYLTFKRTTKLQGTKKKKTLIGKPRIEKPEKGVQQLTQTKAPTHFFFLRFFLLLRPGPEPSWSKEGTVTMSSSLELLSPALLVASGKKATSTGTEPLTTSSLTKKL